MRKHKVVTKKYEDSPDHPGYFCCENCELFMGLRYGVRDGHDYSYLDKVYSEDGECPGHPVGETITKGFREFWISPGYGGNITDAIRRLYGGSGHLSEVEKVTQKEFESDYGPCLAMRIMEDGDLEAVTEEYIVTVHEYDGSEYLECVERTPEWFRDSDSG